MENLYWKKKVSMVIFRGSKNQRILDIKKSLSLKKACEVSKYKNKEEVVIKKEYVFV